MVSKTVSKVIKLLLNYDSMCKRFDVFEAEVNTRMEQMEKSIGAVGSKIDQLLLIIASGKNAPTV